MTCVRYKCLYGFWVFWHSHIQFIVLAVLMPLQGSLAYPSSINNLASGYSPWDETSMMINASSSQMVPSQDDFTSLHGIEGMDTPFWVNFFVIIVVD